MISITSFYQLQYLMPFWKCYYHIIWATKNREPRLTEEHETLLFPLVKQIATGLGSEIFAVNGTEDHIHIAMTCPPKLAISGWVKQVKGKTSHEINSVFTNKDRFRWQRGYGVLSYGRKQLPFVIRYIENQKQHHASNTLEDYLEIIEP